jgi:hypothetical protein
MEISISKEVLPSLDEYGFEETILGDARGSIRQYRKSGGLHVREYPDKFVVHQDAVDPRIDPVGHLIKDSPETLVAFGVAVLLSHRESSSDSKPGKHMPLSPLVFILSFLSLNRILGVLKRLL